MIEPERVTWDGAPQGRAPLAVDEQALANARRSRRRVLLFAVVFLLASLSSLVYTFQRPALFESIGVLHIVPKATDRNQTLTEESIDVQVQMLMNQPLLDRLSQAVVQMPGFKESAVYAGASLDEMLHVDTYEGSRIVELRAVGSPPEFLAALVNAWTEIALEIHDARRASATAVNTEALAEKQLELQARVAQKREELDRFRRDNSIVSMEREENQILAQQKGIAQALSRADEELAAAKAELDAIEQAGARGEPVIKSEDSRSLANLEQRAELLRAELQQYTELYTPTYMQMDPKIVALRRNLLKIEEEIQAKSNESSRLRRAEAEQAYSAAQNKLASLREKMLEYQRQTLDFTNKFNEYSAMQEELTQLETLQRGVQERLVKVQVDLDRIPELQVLDRASLPDDPFYPKYWRDAGLSVLGSLLLALLAVLLHDFFFRALPSAQRVQPWPVLYPLRDAARPAIDASPVPRVAQGEARMLGQELPQELPDAAIEPMLGVADAQGRLIIYALLSGLTLEEAAALSWSDLELERGLLHVPGVSSRNLVMPACLQPAFADCMAESKRTDGAVWSHATGEPLGTENLAAMVSNLAHDAGIPDPGQTMSVRLRHSYILFLLRQGIRLSELKRIVGDMAPADLSRYRPFTPPGAAVSLDQVELTHPLVARVGGAQR